MYLRLAILGVAAMSAGCPLFYDLEDAPFLSDTAVANNDSNAPDAALEDADAATVDVPADMPDPIDMADMPPPDLGPSGMLCADGVPLTGTCNLVTQDCSGGQICEVGLLMPGVETGCRTQTAGVSYTLEVGAACTPAGMQRCRPGLLCRDAACERYCYTETGLGCPTAEFCAPLDSTNLPGVGWCSDSCP
jgi:hypothetical protein